MKIIPWGGSLPRPSIMTDSSSSVGSRRVWSCTNGTTGIVFSTVSGRRTEKRRSGHRAPDNLQSSILALRLMRKMMRLWVMRDRAVIQRMMIALTRCTLSQWSGCIGRVVIRILATGMERNGRTIEISIHLTHLTVLVNDEAITVIRAGVSSWFAFRSGESFCKWTSQLQIEYKN